MIHRRDEEHLMSEPEKMVSVSLSYLIQARVHNAISDYWRRSWRELFPEYNEQTINMEDGENENLRTH